METNSNQEVLTVDPDQVSYPGINCFDMTVNAYYAGVHAISKNTYDIMVDDFFVGAPPAEKRHLSTEFDMTECICENYIPFDTGTDPSSNADIIFDLPHNLVGAVKGKYSVHFFRGLQHFFPIPASGIQYYEFSKAKHKDGSDAIVMRVVTTEGTVLYRGNLTNMLP